MSAGCLAMGDDAIEELFWLAAPTGVGRFTVVIALTDLRRVAPPTVDDPVWLPEFYRELTVQLSQFP